MSQKDNFGRKVQNYKGTYDYDKDNAKKRLYVIGKITEVFELFGFEPLITPALELDRVLRGKYGEEGELNRFKLSVRDVNPDAQAGLRYDHTVPLARYMAMNPTRNTLPYRRFAIGPVWRYENIQAGRLREFTQCDFDTVGSSSLLVDAEIMAINYAVLTALGFGNYFEFQFNDRRLLNAMTRLILKQDDERSVELLRAWDKLEKVGVDSVCAELSAKKVINSKNSLFAESEVLDFREFTESLLQSENPYNFLLQELPKQDTPALQAINDLATYAASQGVPYEVMNFNPLLARGLDYYTGPIFETVVKQAGVGSIGGGGRFDNLVEALGGPNLPASGSSFGLERVISVMETLNIPIPIASNAPVFVCVMDSSNIKTTEASFKAASMIRLDGIDVEVYTGDQSKLGKQLEIALKKGSKVAIIIGENEIAKNEVTIKDLTRREQKTVKMQNIGPEIRKILS